MKTNVYVLGNDQKYIKVNVSKSSILKAFKDKKKELSAYIKEQGINIKEPGDLLAVVQYYYTL